MTPEHVRQIEELYHAARERSPEERVALLAKADPEVRREVESLLAQPSGEFLDRPAVQNAPQLLDDSTVTVLTPGDCLGPYRIESKLGEGGMGEVYRAVDTRLGRAVAIKVAHQQFSARFEREARAISSLNHANICTLYDVGPNYLVMELLEGDTLVARLKKGPLPIEMAQRYGAQIAAALAEAHEKGIIHRDLKPGNIIIAKNGAKVLDFGLAKSQDSETLTGSRAVMGTPAYMAPEQREGKECDARSDIYALGLVLYEMAAGKRPPQDQPAPMGTLPEGLAHLIERCLERDPERRWQTARDIGAELEWAGRKRDTERSSGPEQPKAGAKPGAARGIAKRWRVIATAAAVVVALGSIWWLSRPRAGPTKVPTLVRLTSDSGLATDPTLSADGKLLAYASDRAATSGAEGNLDIYVQQPGSGSPVRLTNGPLDNTEPAFSPDGTKIAFRSERDGGGIYVIPSLGGEARLIAQKGRRPRFSPDGSQIAYWVGEFPTIPSSAGAYVIPASGGPPRQLQPDFSSTGYPVWAPDGRHILFVGYRGGDRNLENLDWWVASLDSGPAIKTGALQAIRDQGAAKFASRPVAGQQMQDVPVPGMWARGDQVVFSGLTGGSANLWQIPISAKTWHVAGALQRLTFGTGLEVKPAVAGSRVVFSSSASNDDIWALPADTNRGKALGEAQRLTRDAAVDWWPSASADGKRVVFLSSRSGNFNVWLKDLETGKETALTATPEDETSPHLNSDGSKVFYGVGTSSTESRLGVYVMAIGLGGSPGVEEKICSRGCGRPDDWSPDSQRILSNLIAKDGWRLLLLDLASGQPRMLTRHPQGHQLGGQRLSPDGRWVSFVETPAPTRRQVFIAPITGTIPIPPSEWIPITDGQGLDREPRWSPDGNLLYFLSERDGFRCFWAQRLDPATKHPVGDAFPVQHFHRTSFYLRYPDTATVGYAIARDKIVFAMAETTGNIWMTELQGQK